MQHSAVLIRISIVLSVILTCYTQVSIGQICDDPRMKGWSEMFRNGESEQLVTDAKNDLLSDHPHPFASAAWLSAAERTGFDFNNPGSWAAGKPNDMLKALCEFKAYFQEDKLDEYLKKYTSVQDLPEVLKDQPIVLIELYWAAFTMSNGTLTLDFALQMDRKFPDEYFAHNALYKSGSYYLEARSTLLEMIQKGEISNPVSRKYLERSLTTVLTASADRMHLMEEHLKEASADFRANRQLGINLYALENYAKAYTHYEAAFVQNPFFNLKNNVYGMAKCLLSERKYDETRALLHMESKLVLEDGQDLEYVAAKRYTWLLMNVGEYGLAEVELDSISKRYPNEKLHYVHKAQFEIDNSRYDKGVIWAEKALEVDPDLEVNILYYLEGLYKSKDYEAVVSYYQEFLTQKDIETEYIFHYVLESYRKQENYLSMYEVSSRAVEQHPESSWMHHNKIHALRLRKLNKEALVAHNQMIEQTNKLSLWVAGEYRRNMEQLVSDEELEKELRAFRTQYASYTNVWKDAINQVSGDYKARDKENIWKEALRSTEKEVFPYVEIATLLKESYRFDEANAYLDTAETFMHECHPSDRISVHEARVLVYIDMNSRTPDEQVIRNAITEVHKYGNEGAKLGSRYWYYSLLYSKLDMNDSAATYAEKRFVARPDDSRIAFKLADEHSGSLGKGRGMSHYAYYYSRKPLEHKRTNTYIDLHLKYGGSSITAMKVIRDYVKRQPDIVKEKGDFSYYISLSNQRLGDKAGYFKSMYGNRSAIVGQSDVYEGWYQSGRKSAQYRSATVEVDTEKEIAFIYREDGMVEQHKYHPLSGRVSLIQIGAAYVKYSYDEMGDQLQSMESSSGYKLQLEWSDDDEIIAMIGTDYELYIKYNKEGKISELDLKGVGTMKLTWDSYGDIIDREYSDGRDIGNKISEQLSEFSTMINYAKENAGTLPELPFQDDAMDKLFEKYVALVEKGAKNAAVIDAGLQLTNYFISHLADLPSHSENALLILRRSFEMLQGEAYKKNPEAVLKMVDQYHTLSLNIRKKGVTEDHWDIWNEMYSQLEYHVLNSKKYKKQAFDLLNKVNKEPIQILESSYWLTKSPLHNEGFWREYAVQGLFPEKFGSEIKLRCAFITGDGRSFVGTNYGLLELEDGHWVWYGFDERKKQFSKNVEWSKVKATSDILSITVNSYGLWMGTANGLLQFETSIEEKGQRWSLPDEGLLDPQITSLASTNDFVAIGSPSGVQVFDGSTGKFVKIEGLPASPIQNIETAQEGCFVNCIDGVYYIDFTTLKAHKVVANGYQHINYKSDANQLYLTKGNEAHFLQLSSLDFAAQSLPLKPSELRGNQNLNYAKKVHGISRFYNPDGTPAAPVFLTDQGLNFYQNYHFEYQELNHNETKPEALQVASVEGKMIVLSANAIFMFDHQPGEYVDMVVNDMMHMPTLGITIFGSNDGLYYADDADPTSRFQYIEYASVDHMDRIDDLSFVFNDGLEIYKIRFDSTGGAFDFDLLGNVESSMPEKWSNMQGVHGITVDSKGAVWVAAGASVFQFNGSEKKEYCWFKDPKTFDTPTNKVVNVYETVEGEIWAAAAATGWWDYRGVSMKGGLMVFDGEKFVRRETSSSTPWYAKSYTKINDNLAFAGSYNGFTMHADSSFLPMYLAKDPSYDALRAKRKNLFLATEGTKVGEDLWLFGTPGGVVGYSKGLWFHADRINRMLPNDHLNQYGSRHVTSIAANNNGKIFVGTENGVLIHQTHADDPQAFLISNDQGQQAFSYLNQQRLLKEQQIVKKLLPKNSRVSELFEEYQRLSEELAMFEKADDLKKYKLPGAMTQSRLDSLSEAMIGKKRMHAKMLLNLQREYPSLYQLLELKPLDLLALQKKLTGNQLIVQYLPANDRLFIQTISSTNINIKEVVVGEELLNKLIDNTAKLLKASAAEQNTKVSDELIGNLSQLYELLLRPIELQASSYEHVLISPVGKLCYVPFQALVRKKGSTPEYAIERFKIGYLTSLYMFDLAMSRDSTANDAQSLIVGNPDGTLSGAEKEALSIFKIMTGKKKILLRTKATKASFTAMAPQSKIVHLATHGNLQESSPDESYLKFANGQKLTMTDAMTLPYMTETELVVLSACEAGVGADGMEYATLARAFTQVGVPTVVASLWKVDDEATSELMVLFYKNIEAGEDWVTALTNAQLSLIKSDNVGYQHPSKWSPFIMYGKLN
jgi:CHAT domain-containing protein